MARAILDEKRTQVFGFSLFALIGLIAAAVGIYLLSGRISDKKRCTESVTAVVVDLERVVSSGSKKSITYAPVFEYTYHGTTYHYISPISSRPPDYRRGETASLMIDPNDPNIAYVNDKTATMFILICLGFGVLFAVFGGVGIIRTLRAPSAKDTLPNGKDTLE